jgi:type II secretory ATPase GspE/PulE/Tfp pilus assembly ATPase PilB-like protein
MIIWRIRDVNDMLHTAENDSLEHQPLKIGSLLVNEGFIRKADVADAIAIQKREAAMADLPLGKLLVKQGAITKQQLQTLLENPELRDGIGVFAIEQGLIDEQQLAESIRRNPPYAALDNILISEGYITDEDLKVFLKQQLNSMKLCELALHLDMVPQGVLQKAINIKRYQRTFGEVLCDLSLITPLDLNAVLKKYRKHLRLGEILVKQGIIDEPTLNMALLEQESRSEPLGNILLEKNLLTQDQLFKAFSAQYNIPYNRLDGFEYDEREKEELVQIIGKTFARQFRIVPLLLSGHNLTVVIADPENLKVVHSLRSKRSDLRTDCVLVSESDLDFIFQALYSDSANFTSPKGRPEHQKIKVPIAVTPPPHQPQKTVPPLKEKPPAPVPDAKKQTAADPHPNPEEFVQLMLAYAIQSSAQAIHIDQDIEGTTLQYRQNGILQPPSPEWLEEKIGPIAVEVIGVIKEMSGLDANDTRLPQDGVFRGTMVHQQQASHQPFDISVTTCPTLAGENITIKILQPCPAAPTLGDLGHSQQLLSSLKRLLKNSNGLVLVAGPPVSGKAASLYGMLQLLNKPRFKIITVEDPIAFSLPGVIQTQMNPGLALDYPSLMRTAIRLDPDIILAGDIPDAKTAFWGIEAARKGRLLLAGIQAIDGANAVTILKNLGITPRHIALHLKGIIAQRHVRRICPSCKHAYHPMPDEWQPLFDAPPNHLTFYKGAGCPECEFTGYKGHILISELLTLNDTLSWAIQHGKDENDIRHLAIRSGMKTLIDDGLLKLSETTLPEIIDVAPLESIEAFKCKKADACEEEDQQAKNPNRVDPKPHLLLLSSPRSQKEDIARLYNTYESMSSQTKGMPYNRTKKTFETFITANYLAVCKKYNCQKVSFSLHPRGTSALILASPVLA